MKKIIVLIASILVLIGCSQQNIEKSDVVEEIKAVPPVVIENTSSYSNDHLAISFKYPMSWKVVGAQDSSVSVASSDGSTFFTVPSTSFEEYETEHKEEIDDNYITVNNTQLKIGNKTYSAKQYAQHGGTRYLLKVDEKYVSIVTEMDILGNGDLRKQIATILGSLKFYKV